MPLDALVPTIDDRRFDEIVAEARTRIPRYTPEWTDLNDNDPGMALVQLFAWMADMLLYRLAKVPELNYLKFLALLGIELNPAEPATTEVVFPVLDAFPDPFVIVPRRTQVSAEAPAGGAPIVFETETSLVALKARLTAVLAFDGYAFSDHSAANDEGGEGFEPFGALVAVDSALCLGFTFADLFPQVDLSFMVWVSDESARSGSAQPSRCGLPESPRFAPAALAWETWNGSAWQSVRVLSDETRAFTESGHIYLRTPGAGVMKKRALGGISEQLYWIRARLERTAYERPPRLLAIRTNTASVRQAETVRDEVLGGSTGAVNQRFQLANTPVLADTLVVEVDEGSGFAPWTRVDDFFGSTPQSQHYVVDRTSGRVAFGDGAHGRIPVGNVANPTANIVARHYRFGGGTRGNVAANRVTTLLTTIAGIDEAGVTNPRAASPGRDEEPLSAAMLRAPQALKNKGRAVTDEDFESLAREAANIRRAKALPLFHPAFPGVKVPGVVSIIVVPDSDAPNPTPSEGTRRTVCAYLNLRRLLTTEVFVLSPTYERVEVSVEAIAHDTADLAEVTREVESALTAYFHPLEGGDDKSGWPFGGTIHFSRVYQRVFSSKGVRSIERLVITVNGEPAAECRDVPIREGALLYSKELDVRVRYQFDS